MKYFCEYLFSLGCHAGFPTFMLPLPHLCIIVMCVSPVNPLINYFVVRLNIFPSISLSIMTPSDFKNICSSACSQGFLSCPSTYFFYYLNSFKAVSTPMCQWLSDIFLSSDLSPYPRPVYQTVPWIFPFGC